MEDELGLIMDVIETKEPREGRELAIKEQDSGSTFNLIFFPPPPFPLFCARRPVHADRFCIAAV